LIPSDRWYAAPLRVLAEEAEVKPQVVESFGEFVTTLRCGGEDATSCTAATGLIPIGLRSEYNFFQFFPKSRSEYRNF
jgi:hypothetical protein